jgi:hypothetical protein
VEKYNAIPSAIHMTRGIKASTAVAEFGVCTARRHPNKEIKKVKEKRYLEW